MSISPQTSSAHRAKLLQEAAEKIAILKAAPDTPVQEGDVSSSHSAVLATELFGSLLFEKLSGFLFVVNSQGRIVSVTDNISQYIGYEPAQWVEQSIYDFIHVVNHASFGQILLALMGDGKQDATEYNKPLPPFRCRISQCLSDGDRKKEGSHINMQVSSLPYTLSSPATQNTEKYLLCVAQRIVDPLLTYTRTTNRMNRRLQQHMSQQQHMNSSVGSSELLLASPGMLDFTTQVSKDLTVVSCDLRNLKLSENATSHFVGKKLIEFVHTNDVTQFQKHMEIVSKGGGQSEVVEHSSSIYRFKLSDTQYVFVQTKSQLIDNTAATHSSAASASDTSPATASSSTHPYIYSVHSIVRKCDSNELKGSASTSLMKAIIHSNNVGAALQTSSHGTSQQALVRGILPSSAVSPAYMPSKQSFNTNPTASQQRLQQQLNNSAATTPLPHQNHSASAGHNNMAMMSGMQQLQDVNFNEVNLYGALGGTLGGAGGGDNGDGFGGLGSFDNGMSGNWTNSLMSPHQQQPAGVMQTMGMGNQLNGLRHSTANNTMLLQQGLGQHQQQPSSTMSMNASVEKSSLLSQVSRGTFTSSYQTSMSIESTAALSQHCNNSNKLKDLLSSVDSMTGNEASPSSHKASPANSSGGGGAGNEEVLRKLLQASDDDEYHDIMNRVRTGKPASVGSKADTSDISPASNASSSSKGTENQLLKKLLCEVSSQDQSKSDILPVLMKTEEGKEAQQKCIKSPVAQSPTTTTSNRRRSSGGSSKDSKSVNHRWEDTRGTKRKISSTSTIHCTPEPDSTNITPTPLNKLLESPIASHNKVTTASEITATPQEKLQALKAQKGKSKHSNNIIVDVIGGEIMIGTERMDIDNYVMGGSGQNMYSGNLRHQAPNSAGAPMIANNQQLPIAMDTLSAREELRAGNYQHNKSYYELLGRPPTREAVPPNHLNFVQSQSIPSSAMGSGKVENGYGTTSGNSTRSMLDQLLNTDPDVFIQELEQLLGGPSSTMQMTSPEDELAIRDIEKQLLNSIENLPTSHHQYHRTAEPHSPGYGIAGLTNVPASASNPIHSPAINISHRPPISNNHNAAAYGMGGSMQQQQVVSPNSQPHQTLRAHLQQGAGGMRNMMGRAVNRPASRQNSITNSRSSISDDGRLRRHSGSNASSLPPFSPNSNNNSQLNNFPIGNLGAIMKSSEPPPNIRLPAELSSNQFPPMRGNSSTDMMHTELSSPHAIRMGPNFSPSPMDIGGSQQQRFSFNDTQMNQYRQQHSNSLLQRQLSNSMPSPLYGPTGGDQHMSNGMHSPQQPGMRTGVGVPPHMDPLTSQYNTSSQYNPQLEQVNSAVPSSQYVRQEMRNKLAAKAQQQNTSPQHHNFQPVSQQQQHAMSSQLGALLSPQTSQHAGTAGHMGPPPSYSPSGYANMQQQHSTATTDTQESISDSVLPDDILDQITELTDSQNEIQQQRQQQQQQRQPPNPASMHNPPNEHEIAQNKINQSKKESGALTKQLRLLAGASGPDSLFRKQLGDKTVTTSTSQASNKTANHKGMSAREIDKLKHSGKESNISIIRADPPAPSIDGIQPADQSSSLLQQLLTERYNP